MISRSAPQSSDANVDAEAALYLKDCIPGTAAVTPLANGGREYNCTKKRDRKNNSSATGKHTFSTNLQTGSKGYTLSAAVDSAWGHLPMRGLPYSPVDRRN
ncbi:hypothetical protein BGZ73_008822 [Actinomortierella ambigua]|nr:hypothetical protein BGZ73_008822 [Actinomortierella ambigua]